VKRRECSRGGGGGGGVEKEVCREEGGKWEKRVVEIERGGRRGKEVEEGTSSLLSASKATMTEIPIMRL